uniref:Stathmin n=1 Tax=Steinernema glaseri TaxID=37863 RepID=A0A1I7Z8N1_9BILA
MSTRKETRSLQTNSLDEVVRFATSKTRHQEGLQEVGLDPKTDGVHFSAKSLSDASGIAPEEAQRFEQDGTKATGDVMLRVTLKTFSLFRDGYEEKPEPCHEQVEIKEDLPKNGAKKAILNLEELHEHALEQFEKNTRKPKARSQLQQEMEPINVIHLESTKDHAKLQLRGKKVFYATESLLCENKP